VRDIGRELLPDYHDGLFFADRTRRFTGEVLLESLETLIEVLVGWARDYQFDPECVEAGFGLPGATWPAWRLSLDGGRDLLLRGRMDRVDAWRDPATGTALVVVMDYKASGRKPDQLKLHHGLELQLPAYLAVLEHLPEASVTFRATRLVPAGAFYVNLRGEFTSKKSRTEALDDPARALRESFQHSGRYDESFLEKLDPAGKAEQFKTHPRSYDRMGSQAFRSLLDRTVQNLRRFGEEIFAGRIEPEPYRKGSEVACGQCDYRAVCRFDPWTEPFRQLSRPSAVTTPPGSNRTKKPPEHR